jgi:hypothetical protein
MRSEEFQKMTKEAKIVVNGRKMRLYGFNDSAENVITLSTAKTGVKLPLYHLSFKNLLTFDASYSSIDKIDEIGNETFPYLKLLNLSHNAISSVKSLFFSHLKEVEMLDLSHNCFVEFHIDIVFLKHEKLKELYLQDNLLHEIHSLIQVPKAMTLNFLDISNNFLQTFKNFDMEIKHLRMNHNELESVEIYHGDQMTLHACCNKLKKFSSSLSFELLNLSHNELEFLSDVKFKAAYFADFSCNNLEKWATKDENLSELERSQEEINSNEENPNKQLQSSKIEATEILESVRIKVKDLNLAHNNLGNISELFIYKDCNYLNLEGNKLKNIDLEDFRVLFPELKRVNLVNNPLSPVDEIDLKFFNTTQFLQLHFEYDFVTATPPTSTMLPTLFFPSLHTSTKAAVTLTTPVDKVEPATASSDAPQTESTTHRVETKAVNAHGENKLRKLFSEGVSMFALVTLIAAIASLIFILLRSHQPQIFSSRQHGFNEAENYF